jgi:Tfp pilus assembly protein PilE
MGILMITRTVQGFMMIELSIAILIMAIMGFVCMGYYTKTVIIQKDTALYLQATTLVSSAMEKLLSEKILPTQNQHKEGLFTIDWHTQQLDNKQFVVIEATVSWQSMLNTPKTITIRSGFAPQAGVLT